jgi:hypothetical protein
LSDLDAGNGNAVDGETARLIELSRDLAGAADRVRSARSAEWTGAAADGYHGVLDRLAGNGELVAELHSGIAGTLGRVQQARSDLRRLSTGLADDSAELDRLRQQWHDIAGESTRELASYARALEELPRVLPDPIPDVPTPALPPSEPTPEPEPAWPTEDPDPAPPRRPDRPAAPVTAVGVAGAEPLLDREQALAVLFGLDNGAVSYGVPRRRN